MKRLYLILIIIGATVAVATPSIYLGVYFYSKNRVKSTDVSIESFEINDISDTSLSGKINFTLSQTTTTDATFTINNATVAYESVILGIVHVATSEFSTQQANHLTDFTLEITNQGQFTTFVNDFTARSQLEIVLTVEIKFSGALAALPKQTVTKTIALVGLQELSFSFYSFALIDVTDDALHLEVNATIDNPTALNVNISQLKADIQFESSPLGNVTKSRFIITSGTNDLLLDTWLTGPKETLSTLLGNYFSKENSTLSFNYTITLGSTNDGYQFESAPLTFVMEGIQTNLVTVEVKMINLDISNLPSTVSYIVDTTVFIHNPVDFEINVSSFTGLLTYDDEDGAEYSIPLVQTWTYSPLANISLTPLDFNWTSAPLMIDGLDVAQENYTFSDSNIEQGIRLFDEYEMKNQLCVNIINGVVTIQIE